ncbi:MAG: sulfatase-like hydrolase/transferase [Acidimicrobiia bacterium]|nr:sulfatase-like hydrolase/transferase [Acidimicrobiia bacterium]
MGTVSSNVEVSKGWESRLSEAGGQKWWWQVLAVAAVGALTVSHTVLTIVGDAPAFFVAKRMTPVQVVLVGVGITLIPAILAVPVLVARRSSTRVSGILLSLIVGGLVGVLVGHVLDGLDQTGEVVVAVGGLVCVGVAVLYGFSDTARGFVQWLSPAPLVVLWLFLFASPTSALLSNGTESAAANVLSGSSDTPIVILVVDELPLATVMDSSGSFLQEAFPGIGSLVDDGVWYRNAVSNSRSTVHAIPALSTGYLPDPELLPTADDHRHSLFTALSQTHRVSSVEPLTSLCPEKVCDIDDPVSVWGSVLSDVGVVTAHVVLPNAIASDLPPIDETWGEFGEETTDQTGSQPDKTTMREDPRLAFDRFESSLVRGDGRPPFVFGHVTLPHIPWHYLADGTRIEGGEKGYLDGVVLDDRWAVALGIQRHLLVTHYVDTRIGAAFDKIRAAGWFDDALIILVSDHGASFESGYHRRDVVTETVDSIAPVPLIVKYPIGYDESAPPGSVDDIRAESVDLAPTVFEVLGLGEPYDLDGVSLLDQTSRSERESSPFVDTDATYRHPVDLEPSLASAATFDQWFPNRDPWEAKPPGITNEMNRTPTEIVDDPDVEFVLEGAGRFEDVDLEREPLPVVLYATVRGLATQMPVGVTVNGELVTHTATYLKGGVIRTAAIIPPSSLRSGRNEVNFIAFSDPPRR